MSTQEMQCFLSKGNVARIATVKPDGVPHVTPVWYLWENNELLIAIVKNSVKERNIKRNSKVAVTIDSNVVPEKGVMVEGTAEIDELSEELERKIYQKYVSHEDLDRYIQHSHARFQPLLLRIDPEKIITWDYSKDPFLSTIRANISLRGF